MKRLRSVRSAGRPAPGTSSTEATSTETSPATAASTVPTGAGSSSSSSGVHTQPVPATAASTLSVGASNTPRYASRSRPGADSTAGALIVLTGPGSTRAIPALPEYTTGPGYGTQNTTSLTSRVGPSRFFSVQNNNDIEDIGNDNRQANNSIVVRRSEVSPLTVASSPSPVGGTWVLKNVNNGFPPAWNEMRLSGLLCDVVLKTVDGQTFNAHRPILAASSEFFKNLFTTTLHQNLQIPVIVTTINATHESDAGDDEDDDEEITNVLFPTIESKSLDFILKFMYTGLFDSSNQTQTENQIKTLLPIVFKFQLRGMLEQCCSYLISNLTPANALETFKFGQLYFCPSLQSTTKLYVLQNFHRILHFPDYLKLEFHELEEFLRDDRLNVKNEEGVFEIVRSWVEYYPMEERLSKLIELFHCIRFGLMSFAYFTTEVFNWKYVCNNQAIEESLYDASIFLSELDSRNGADIDLNDPLARPRIPYQVIFAIGGWSAGSPTSFIETYDMRSDRWFLIPGSDVTPRAYHGLVTLDGLIYMVGGFDGNEHFNTVRCFDPVTKVWTEKACMHHPRCYVSCCVLDRFIYALGGFNGRTRMNSAERYNIDTNQWEEIPTMARQRSDASACAANGKVYVCGGFNGQEVLSSVEVYDPREKQWTYIHPMQTSRSGVTLTFFKGWIYAIGGFNGFTRLPTAEKYNPNDPSDWVPIANMSTPRSNFVTVALDDMLFAIGGFNGTTTIPYVECYDETTNEWFDATPMNLNRSALSACVLNGLPNARDYSYLSRVQELLGIPENGGMTLVTSEHATTAANSNAIAAAVREIIFNMPALD